MLAARRLLMRASLSAPLLALAASSTYSDNTGSVTNHDCPLPSGSQAGELALLMIILNGSPTVTDPSGAVSFLTQTGATATYDTLKVYGRILNSTDISNNYLRVGVNTAQRASGIMYRITGNRSGLVLNTDFAVSTEVAGNLSSVDNPSLTPAWGSARNLWVSLSTGHDGSTQTLSSYSSGYTDGQQNVNTGSGNGNQIAASAKIATGTSDDPGAMTWSGARNRLGYTIALRPQ